MSLAVTPSAVSLNVAKSSPSWPSTTGFLPVPRAAIAPMMRPCTFDTDVGEARQRIERKRVRHEVDLERAVEHPAATSLRRSARLIGASTSMCASGCAPLRIISACDTSFSFAYWKPSRRSGKRCAAVRRVHYAERPAKLRRALRSAEPSPASRRVPVAARSLSASPTRFAISSPCTSRSKLIGPFTGSSPLA